MKYIIKYKLGIIGALVGGLAGYLYWAKIGCLSGTCALKSNPTVMVIYGTILGSVLLDLFRKK